MSKSKPIAITFDFSHPYIQKIALANSRERADELAKDLNGCVWDVNEILEDYNTERGKRHE